MKKEIIAIGLSSLVITSQSLYGSVALGNEAATRASMENLSRLAETLPEQLSTEESAALEHLESALHQLISSGFIAEGTEGEQLVTLIEGLIEAIRARDGREILETGNEILVLVGQIAGNSKVDIGKGFESIRRLVDALNSKDSKAAVAAITDIAITIARIARALSQ